MKIVIIGGGPAGMMAAVAASKNNKNQVYLFEKNEKLGKKIFITGKGRCNATNACDIFELKKHIITNEKFMYSSLNNFDNKSFMKFLEDNGCKIKIERGLRVFPSSDKAYAVTDCFKRVLKEQGVIVKLDTEVVGLVIEENGNNEVVGEGSASGEQSTGLFSPYDFGVRPYDIGVRPYDDGVCQYESKVNKYINKIRVRNLKNGKDEFFDFDKIIITTGGLAYPSTGSTGDGYEFAKSLGMNVNEPIPTLVPIEIENRNPKLDGLLLKNVGLKIYNYENKKLLREDFGDIEFYRNGITGPMVISASSYLIKQSDVVINDGQNENIDKSSKFYYPMNYELKNKLIFDIDLKAALSEKQLDDRIIREIEKMDGKNTIIDLLSKLLPMQMIDPFLDMLNKKITENKIQSEKIDNKFLAQKINKNIRKNIVELLKSYKLIATGIRGFNEAIITRGGVDCKMINPKTMQSKKYDNIYFAGEVLDIDCLTGGFNITIAVSTGWTAGYNASM